MIDEGEPIAQLYAKGIWDENEGCWVSGKSGKVPSLMYVLNRVAVPEAHGRRSLRNDRTIIQFGWGKNGWDQAYARFVAAHMGVPASLLKNGPSPLMRYEPCLATAEFRTKSGYQV